MGVVITRSVRRQLRAFIEEIYEGEDEVDTLQLVQEVQRRFGGDAEFMAALAREALFLIVPSIAASVRHRQRREPVSEDETVRERLAHVFARVDQTRQRSLLAMTPTQHLFAADDHERSASGHMRWAGFHRAIAAAHKGDDRPTGDVLTNGQLDQLYRRHILIADDDLANLA